MSKYHLIGKILLFVVIGCAQPIYEQKITFDIGRLDSEGLYGPPDGKRSLSYEFCIPDREQHKAEVRSIDPTVRFMSSSPGRIGCCRDECLCIGSTHRKDFRIILKRLAGLAYIERIDECLFE